MEQPSQLEGPGCAHCLSGWFCHAVVCPLEVELGPQRLPWLLLLILRNSGLCQAGCYLKGLGLGREGGTGPISVAVKGWSGAKLALLRGRSQVTSGSPTVPMPPSREHSAAEGADILSGLVEFLEYLPG